MTLCNMIESMKSLLHRYGSSHLNYSSSGDYVKRATFEEEKELMLDDSIYGKQRRLYHVLNGKSVELIKPIYLKTYRTNELDPDENCPICITPVRELQNKLYKTQCGHIFCVKCIFPQFLAYLLMRYNRSCHFSDDAMDGESNDNLCPICRHPEFEILGTVQNTSLDIKDYRIRFTGPPQKN